MENSATTKSEDLWNAYKELKALVWKHLNESSDHLSIAEFENALRKHKQSFFALLENPPKNAKSREELRKGMVDGITVKGIGHQILSKELFQEAIILSDMFEINEFVALDLLCTAQIQMPYYPSLPRGLVAVLLYYDGRKAILSALLYLVQARNGVQWSVRVKGEIQRFITEYTNQLMENGLFNRIFELLRNLDLSKELEKLHANLALGGPKHRRQVTDLFKDIRVTLAEIVFIWAAQTGLPKTATVGLINYLRDVKIEEEASGQMDDVNLYLQIALLSALDLSVLHTREDGEEAVQLLPILADPTFIQAVINEFLSAKGKWVSEGLQSLSTFGLAVCLASLRVVPQTQQFQEAMNNEELFIDSAIEMNVFTFIHNILLESKPIFTETYIYKRIHTLITDFIVYMYPKVKEMRLKADDIARTVQVYHREGLEAPPNLPKYFEYLLLSIGKFYSNNQLKTDYMLAYWSPMEISPNLSHASTFRPAPRAVSLFKFIRLAGDMLPSSLFVPYLTMLSGLSSSEQTAQICFNMLKQGGSHVSSTLSWDHFFSSFAQYYNNLRQETPPLVDTVYRNRTSAFHKGVSPQELDGLHAVLLLMRTIAEHNEFARLALCEHPGWSPLTVLLGLVSCSVPIPLKADLLQTLAAFSKSSENATQMWDNLEASQILVTIPTTSSYAPRGIQTELDEIESRMEEYPLTRALLTLLDALTTCGIPRTLGAGPRKPGFDPYLSFILNSVFLKFHSRSYRASAEKWQVAELCLKLFEKFLTQYDPNGSDFPSNVSSDLSSPPGFHLMLQMNSKSEMLNVILDIIDEGAKCFESYVNFHGQELLKDCTLSCLNILHRTLMLQAKFFSLLASSSTSIILTNINKLLLTINRRSGKPDHVVNIAKYVSYQVNLPQHALVAVKILNYINSSPVNHTHFVNILFASDEEKKMIKNGFVECLDVTGDETAIKTKIEILKLLKKCLFYNAPNFSHLLFGFDLKRDVSKTEFQYPGVLNFPRSCLHSLIAILDSATSPFLETQTPLLLEESYHMLYLLASNIKTSSPVLRFVRFNKTFFTDHLLACRKNIDDSLHAFNQMSWLMKTLAIELKIACQAKQVSYIKQLTTFLVNVPAKETRSMDMFNLVEKRVLETKLYSSEDIKLENFMSKLINYFEFRTPEVVSPKWDFFDSNAVNGILKLCQRQTGNKTVDLKKLHKILYDEVRALQGATVVSQIQAITEETPKVLKYALAINKRNESCCSVVEFVNGWRQVVEVLIVYTPLEVLNPIEKQLISISLSVHLLRKMVNIQVLPEVSRLISGAILLMIDNIKSSYLREQKLLKISSALPRVNILELYQSSLREFLEALIEWIMLSDVTDGELRINLYAALVTFLQLSNFEEKHESIAVDSLYVSRLDSSRYNKQEKEFQYQFSSDVITRFGDRLVEVLCNDSVSGQEICKILAMSSFSHLIMLSSNIDWITFMSARGYLKHLVQTVLESDDDLKAMLEPQSFSMKPLYLYLAKMLLLTRLASTRIGAELILEQKLLACFSNMTVFSYHPEISKSWLRDEVFEDFLPDVEQQYLQIWMPTMDICNAILTTLGSENQSAVCQIMYFIISHLDVVELILRSGHPQLSPTNLKELSLVTFVLSRTANNNLINVLENPNIVQNLRSQLHRLQKLMMSLLPKFILSEETIKTLINHSSKDTYSFQTSDRLIYSLQVMSNLLCYCRNIISNHGIEHEGVGVIFYPSLINPLLNSAKKSIVSSSEHDTSLGVIVQQLMSTVNYQHQEKVNHDLLARKILELPDMNSADLKYFIEEKYEMCDLMTKREKALDTISDRLEKKKQEMEYCAYIIENSLYLIWTHLDYYMLKAIPKQKTCSFMIPKALTADTTLASASEATWKVSTDVISSLKQGLISLFNDSFSKQLLETAQDRSESDRGFVEALLRKIKRLVQFVPVK